MVVETRPRRTWQPVWHRLSLEVWGALLLLLLYVFYYLANPAAPGHNVDACCYQAWTGWWDQGRYYESARALAHGDLSAARHWYPLGYPALGALFSFLGAHLCFPVDIACVLVAYFGFLTFAEAVDVSRPVAVVLFLLTVCADPMLFKQWVIPWNSSPVAALIWCLLAATAAHLDGMRRPLMLGLLAGAISLMRPADAVVGAICLTWVAVADLRAGTQPGRAVVLMLGGLAALIVPYALLYHAIYGWLPSAYAVNSRAIGFTAHHIIWRAYVLLIEPRQWFFSGQGLLAHAPWLPLGIAGAVLALVRGGLARLAGLCLTTYCFMMLAYVDLLPTGLWRYYNVHYFKWTWPGFGLLAWLLLRRLYRRDSLAWVVLGAVLLLSCLRVNPRPASQDEPAVAVDIPGITATERSTTMSPELTAIDAQGTMPNITMMRAFPFPDGNGVRLIGLKRDFAGEPVLQLEGSLVAVAEGKPMRRWAEHVTLGYPCWLPPYPCKGR